MHLQHRADYAAHRFHWRLALTVGVMVLGGSLWLTGLGLPTGVLLLNPDMLLRYPGALCQSISTTPPVESLWDGYWHQHVVFVTSSALPDVLHWYLRTFNLGKADPAPALGSCKAFNTATTYLGIAHAYSLMLCSETQGTRIYVDRTICWDK